MNPREAEARLRREYPSAESVAELARDMGYAVGTIRRMASRIGVHRKRFSCRHTPETRRRIGEATRARWQAWREARAP